MDHLEMKTAAENAMKAFEALKTDVLPLKKKFEDLDGETKGQFAKMEKTIGDAIELSHKEAVARKTLEDQSAAFEAKQKVLETELTEVKAAFNRQPIGPESKDSEKELAEKRTKLFNDFARLPDDGQKVYLDSFLRKNAKDDVEFKALSANSEPNGGYLLTPEFGGVIQTRVFESSPIRQLASAITIGTDTWEVILDNDQNTSGWVGELTARTDTTTPQFGKLTIFVNEMFTQPKASQKMLDDATVNIESWLIGKASEEFGRKEATSFVSGNGVMQPKGLLSYTNGTDVSLQQIEQVNSGSAGAFTYAGLVNLQASLKEQYQANATFLLKRGSIANIMTIVDGQARPIFNLMFDKNIGLEPTIMGRPARFANDMPTVASAALALAYGDFREGYQIVDRSGIRVLRDPFTDKPNVRFYTTKRVGGGVKNFEAIKLQRLS